MKLVTFQSAAALKKLVNDGCLECDPQYIDLKKYGSAYSWVTDKMDAKVKNREGAEYPIWCWVRFKNAICPPRHKGKPVPGYEVKITFHKQPGEVFVTDYRRYSFVLNHRYIPDSLEDKAAFDEKLKLHEIPEGEIERSFDRCITYDSDVLQGCVWRILYSEVEKIEFLNDPDCQYGTFNYERKDGRRFDWIEDFYKRL